MCEKTWPEQEHLLWHIFEILAKHNCNIAEALIGVICLALHPQWCFILENLYKFSKYNLDDLPKWGGRLDHSLQKISSQLIEGAHRWGQSRFCGAVAHTVASQHRDYAFQTGYSFWVEFACSPAWVDFRHSSFFAQYKDRKMIHSVLVSVSIKTCFYLQR